MYGQSEDVIRAIPIGARARARFDEQYDCQRLTGYCLDVGAFFVHVRIDECFFKDKYTGRAPLVSRRFFEKP